MKKILCLIFSLLFIFSLCGCTKSRNKSDLNFSQSMTITFNDTNESKTTKSITDIETMLEILAGIHKLEEIEDWIGDVDYKIEIIIDDQNLTYMFGGKTFCDLDGKLYKVKNAHDINDKINNLYVVLAS